jgi:hypothetical protein
LPTANANKQLLPKTTIILIHNKATSFSQIKYLIALVPFSKPSKTLFTGATHMSLLFKGGPRVKNGPINIVHIFCHNIAFGVRIPFQLRKWHVAGTQLRELIFEI